MSLAYVLRLDDGQEIDRTDSNDPLQFLQGHGSIIPGLEKAIEGLTMGDEKKVALQPDHAYGEYDPDDFEVMPRSAFPDDLDLREGVGLRFRDSDSDEVINAYVAEIGPDGVKVDFNHPLAGETLYFDLKIVGVRPATAEEVAHGHVHNGHAHQQEN